MYSCVLVHFLFQRVLTVVSIGFDWVNKFYTCPMPCSFAFYTFCLSVCLSFFLSFFLSFIFSFFQRKQAYPANKYSYIWRFSNNMISLIVWSPSVLLSNQSLTKKKKKQLKHRSCILALGLRRFFQQKCWKLDKKIILLFSSFGFSFWNLQNIYLSYFCWKLLFSVFFSSQGKYRLFSTSWSNFPNQTIIREREKS